MTYPIFVHQITIPKIFIIGRQKKIIDIVRDTYDWQKNNYKILKNYLN